MEISACSFAAFLTFLYQELYVGWASGLNKTIAPQYEDPPPEGPCETDELQWRVASEAVASTNASSESAPPAFSAAGFGAAGGGMSVGGGAAAVAVDGIGVGGVGGAGGAGESASLLVSPLVVAGMVIGLVLLLSCVTIVAGSLKKDSRSTGRGSQLGALPAAGQDGFSYSGSHGDLSLSRMERYSTAMAYEMCDETVSRLNLTFLDAPPRYEDCIRPSTLILPMPSDAPPPYSLTDPCWDHGLDVGGYPGNAGGPSHGAGIDVSLSLPGSEPSASMSSSAGSGGGGGGPTMAQVPIRVFAADAASFSGEPVPVFVSRSGERLWPLRVVDERGVVRMSVSFVAAIPPPPPPAPPAHPLPPAAAPAAQPPAAAAQQQQQPPESSVAVPSVALSLATVSRNEEAAAAAGTGPSRQRDAPSDGAGDGGGGGRQEQRQSTSEIALDQLVPPAYVDAPTYASMPRAGSFCILKDSENEYETIPQVIS